MFTVGKKMKKKAQALVELAIFGSIILMLLGVILSYGLRYSFQQRAHMHSFRKALEKTKNRELGGYGNYIFLEDRHIPNPVNPWGLGTVSSFISSANVVRGRRLHETADFGHPEELPQITFEIKGSLGSRTYTFKTAGFRRESTTCSSLKKYYEIYGQTNIAGGKKCEEGEDDKPDKILDEYTEGTDDEDEVDGDSDPEEEEEENNNPVNITIIDSCEGEIINYNGCYRQCRLIVDEQFCINECRQDKIEGDDTKCPSVCSKQINIPWYCQDYVQIANPEGSKYSYSYIFPRLDSIFGFVSRGAKSLGLSSDYQKQLIMDNEFTRRQHGSAISTADIINWTDITRRHFVILRHLDQATGEALPATVDNLEFIPDENVVTEYSTWDCSDGVCR